MLQLPLLYQTCESSTSAVAFGGNRLDWNWQCGDEDERERCQWLFVDHGTNAK